MKGQPKGQCPSCGKRGLGIIYRAAATQCHPARSYRQCQYCSEIKWLGLTAKLEAAGFVATAFDGVPAMHVEHLHGSALATNRKGTDLPAEGDWALTSWGLDNADEAITDIQCDDEGADIDAAIAAVLADIRELQQEGNDA